MREFDVDLAAFANYFESMAQVSGALVGLVFVALTFNNRLLGTDGHPGMRALAHQVFADFLVLLVLSLIMLVPRFAPQAVALFLIASATIGIVRIARAVVAILRAAGDRAERSVLLQRFGLSLLGNGFFLCCGMLLYAGRADSTFWSLLLTGSIALLISGSRSAWILVTHPRKPD